MRVCVVGLAVAALLVCSALAAEKKDESIIVDIPKGRLGKSRVKAFRLDSAPVTNARFRRFVRDTRYVSDAEKYGWSFVLANHLSQEQLAKSDGGVKGAEHWVPVPRSYWRQPEGRGSSIKSRLNTPAVHMSYNDAQAFCAWAGGRLATAAEWEYAARGTSTDPNSNLPWDASEYEPSDRMNVWEGDFPKTNAEEDGYVGPAPIDAYPAQSDFGLYQLLGNTWEWVSDPYAGPRSPDAGKEQQFTLRGGSYVDSADGKHNHKVDVTTAMGNSADAGSDNLSFRCAYDKKPSSQPSKSEL